MPEDGEDGFILEVARNAYDHTGDAVTVSEIFDSEPMNEGYGTQKVGTFG